MGIIPDAERMTVVVDPTRIKGDRRVFKNVIPATTEGMSYNPAEYDLLVVHEPKSHGYRCIALDAVVEETKPKAQKQTPKTLENRGWMLSEMEKRRAFHNKGTTGLKKRS